MHAIVVSSCLQKRAPGWSRAGLGPENVNTVRCEVYCVLEMCPKVIIRMLPVLVVASCARSGCDGQGAARRDPATGLPARVANEPPAPDRDDEEWDVVDPYCGMRLRSAEVAATYEFRGAIYSFCMADHRDAFARDPERYLASVASGDERADAGGSDTDAPEPVRDGSPLDAASP